MASRPRIRTRAQATEERRLAFAQLQSQRLSRPQIQARLGISCATYYRLAAAVSPTYPRNA